MYVPGICTSGICQVCAIFFVGIFGGKLTNC